MGNVCGKFLREILTDKILWENLEGKSCGKNLAGNVYGKILQEIHAGNSCRKFLREILVEQGGREKANLRKAVIGGN